MISDRIKELRDYLDKSQTDFGKNAGLTRDAVNNIEHNRAKIAESTIIAICSTYNVRREWLETGVGEMFIESSESALHRLAAEHNLGPNQKALLSVAMEALDTLDDAACEILIDRLFAKIMEIKQEQHAVDLDSRIVQESAASDAASK